MKTLLTTAILIICYSVISSRAIAEVPGEKYTTAITLAAVTKEDLDEIMLLVEQGDREALRKKAHSSCIALPKGQKVYRTATDGIFASKS